MGIDEHFPNLGDQAIAAAVPYWINKHFEGEIVELAFNEKFDYLPVVEKNIESGDLIFLQSGGTFGDTWLESQLIRERILSRLRGHPVIQLPQTVYFSNTEKGNERLSECRRVIEAHGQFTIVSRDHRSADIARQAFPSARVMCYPDMALLLDPIVQARIAPNREGGKVRRVLAILRADREGVLGQDQKTSLKTHLSEYQVEYWDTDPVVDVFPKTKRIETILKYLRFVASFDAVVTDRFHGLIFSLLTRRPCVVMATHNHKITSALDWFTDVPFAALATDLNEVPAILARVAAVPNRSVPDWEARYSTPMAVDLGGRP